MTDRTVAGPREFSMSDNFIDFSSLKQAIDSGMIDYAAIQEQIAMADTKKYLKEHKFKIYQGKDGKWNTYVPDNTDKRGRKLIRKNTREEVESAVVKFYKTKEAEPIIADVFSQWVQLKLEYGEIAKQTYDRYVAVFNQYFVPSGLALKKIKSIDEVVLEDFIRRTIHDRQLTVKGWSNLRVIIRGIFKYAKKLKYTSLSISQFMGDLDLSRNIFRSRIILDSHEVFTAKEIEKIRNYIGKKPESLIDLGILLDMKTGLRAGELASIMYSDINGGVLTVQRTEVRLKTADGNYIYDIKESTKGRDGIRNVILPTEALEIIKQIRRLNPFGEYVFQRSDGSRYHGKDFTIRLKKICREVGIVERTLHKLRKTYATMLLNANVDEKLITNQMGHTDITTTKNFYYFDNHELEESKRVINAALNGV